MRCVMGYMKVAVRINVFVILLVGMASCGGPIIKVDMSSTGNLNLNINNEPLPVVVRIYQLSDKGVFESSTFNQLWKSDSKALSKSLLTKNEIILNPGSKDRVELDRHNDAKYVGVVAIFRTPGQRKWRAIYELSTNFLGKRLSSSFNVSLNGNSLHIIN